MQIITSIISNINAIVKYITYLYISKLNIYKYTIYIVSITNPNINTDFLILPLCFSIPATKNNVEIYNNPYILTQEMNIKDIIKIFEKYEIDTEKQFYIFKQNTSLFDLSGEKIERSLKNISEVITNKVEFIKTLISEPILVGIEDKEIINNILNGEM